MHRLILRYWDRAVGLAAAGAVVAGLHSTWLRGNVWWTQRGQPVLPSRHVPVKRTEFIDHQSQTGMELFGSFGDAAMILMAAVSVAILVSSGTFPTNFVTTVSGIFSVSLATYALIPVVLSPEPAMFELLHQTLALGYYLTFLGGLVLWFLGMYMHHRRYPPDPHWVDGNVYRSLGRWEL